MYSLIKQPERNCAKIVLIDFSIKRQHNHHVCSIYHLNYLGMQKKLLSSIARMWFKKLNMRP